MNFKNIQWLRSSAEFKQLLAEGVSEHIHQDKGFCCWLLIVANSVPDKVLRDFYDFAYNACSQTRRALKNILMMLIIVYCLDYREKHLFRRT